MTPGLRAHGVTWTGGQTGRRGGRTLGLERANERRNQSSVLMQAAPDRVTHVVEAMRIGTDGTGGLPTAVPAACLWLRSSSSRAAVPSHPRCSVIEHTVDTCTRGEAWPAWCQSCQVNRHPFSLGGRGLPRSTGHGSTGPWVMQSQVTLLEWTGVDWSGLEQHRTGALAGAPKPLQLLCWSEAARLGGRPADGHWGREHARLATLPTYIHTRSLI